LIETDAPNMLPPERFRLKTVPASEGKEFNHPANLSVILKGIAELLGESSEHLLERLDQNSKRFFGSILT
jgi:Tat protein secretion system quality control protein TatD with DNase activity